MSQEFYLGVVGSNSCNGYYTCPLYFGYRHTDDNSCNGDGACAFISYGKLKISSLNLLSTYFAALSHNFLGSNPDLVSVGYYSW